MKKLLTLMLVALPMMFTSCNDDNDLPQVNIDVEMEGGVTVDDILYVSRGTTLTIKSITCTNLEQGKKAMITGAYFYWNYYFLGATVTPPFEYNIEVTEDAKLDGNLLEIEMPVYAEDKTPANALAVFKVKVVETPEDLPSGASTHATVTPVFKDTTGK